MESMASDRDPLSWLEQWYAGMCNGDWEYYSGIKISTLDNPGWKVTVDLADSPLEGITIPRLVREVSDDNWVHCWVAEDKFQGRGGPKNLKEILAVFAAWHGTIDDA